MRFLARLRPPYQLANVSWSRKHCVYYSSYLFGDEGNKLCKKESCPAGKQPKVDEFLQEAFAILSLLRDSNNQVDLLHKNINAVERVDNQEIMNLNNILFNPNDLLSSTENMVTSNMSLSSPYRRLHPYDNITLPLHLNTIINADVSSYMTIDSKDSIENRPTNLKFPEFNDYLMTLAANICSAGGDKSSRQCLSPDNALVNNVIDMKYDKKMINLKGTNSFSNGAVQDILNRFNGLKSTGSPFTIVGGDCQRRDRSTFFSEDNCLVLLDVQLYKKALQEAAMKRKNAQGGKEAAKDPCKKNESQFDACKAAALKPLKGGSKSKRRRDCCKKSSSKSKGTCDSDKDSCGSKSSSQLKTSDPGKTAKETKPKDPCRSANSKSEPKKSDPCKTTQTAQAKDPCGPKSPSTTSCGSKSSSEPKKSDPCKTATVAKPKDPCRPANSKSSCGSTSSSEPKKTDPCKTTQAAKPTDPCKSSESKSKCASSSASKSSCGPKGSSEPKKSDPCKSTQAAKSKDPCAPADSKSSCGSKKSPDTKAAKSAKSKYQCPPYPCGSSASKTSGSKASSEPKKSDPCGAAKTAKATDPCKSATQAAKSKDPSKSADSKSKSESKSSSNSSCGPKSSSEQRKSNSKSGFRSRSRPTCGSQPAKTAQTAKANDPCKASDSKSKSGSRSPSTSSCGSKTTSEQKQSDPCKTVQAAKSNDPCKPAESKSKCGSRSSSKSSCGSKDSSEPKKSDPCGAAKTAKSTDPCKPADPCGAAKTAKAKDPCKPAESKKSDPCGAAKTAKSTDPCKPADPCGAAKTAKATDPCKPADPCKSKDPCKPADSKSKCGSKSSSSICEDPHFALGLDSDLLDSPIKYPPGGKSEVKDPCAKPSDTNVKKCSPSSSCAKIKELTCDENSQKACQRVQMKSPCGDGQKQSCESEQKKKVKLKCQPPRGDTRPRCKKGSSSSGGSGGCGGASAPKKSTESKVKPSNSTTKASKPATPSKSGHAPKASKPSSPETPAKCAAKSCAPSPKASKTDLTKKSFHTLSTKKSFHTFSTKKSFHTLSMLDLILRRGFSTKKCCKKPKTQAECQPKSERANEFRMETCENFSWADNKKHLRKKRFKESKDCYPDENLEFCPETACYRVYAEASGAKKKKGKGSKANKMQNNSVLGSELLNFSHLIHQQTVNFSTRTTTYQVNEEAYIQSPHKVCTKTCDTPKVSDSDALICVDTVALTDTDIHLFETGGRKAPELTLGNEAAGVVMEVGSKVSHLKPGDHVVLESGIPCFQCDLCKTGRYNICHSLAFQGFLKKQCAHPASFCHKIRENIPLEQAALIPQLAHGCYACHLAGIKTNSNVAIIGSCAITICAAMCALSMGAGNICVMCGKPEAKILIEQYVTKKVDCFDSRTIEKGIVRMILKSLETMPDIVINCSSCTKTMNAAVIALNTSGRCIVAGFTAECVAFNIMDALMKEIQIVPSFRSRNMFPLAIKLLETGRAPLDCLIGNCSLCRWDEIDSAFKLALSANNNGPRKSIIRCNS